MFWKCWKSHFEIRYDMILLPDGALEDFYMDAQLHSFRYAVASKVVLKVYSLHSFQCVQTFRHHPLSGTISTDFTTCDVVKKKSCKYSSIATRTRCKCRYWLIINDHQSCAHKLFSQVMKIFQTFANFRKKCESTWFNWLWSATPWVLFCCVYHWKVCFSLTALQTASNRHAFWWCYT